MLINCNECGKEVSDTAKACPHCGAKVKKEKVVRKKPQGINPCKKSVETATSGTKRKWIYLGTAIGCYAIALCFLILTVLSFAAPYTFLYSEPCIDGYDLIDKLTIKHQTRYQIDIQGDKYTVTRLKFTDSIAVSVSSYVLGASGEIQYRFAKDGNVSVIVFYNGYEIDYVIEDTYPVFVKAYKGYRPTVLSDADRKMSDTAVELSETVLDIVLLKNNKNYDFYDILKDYDDFHKSLTAIKISGIVLLSVFSIVAVSGTVLYVVFSRKKYEATLPKEDDSDNTIDN